MRVTNEQKQIAKNINLYDYLLQYHPKDFRIEKESKCLRPLINGYKSISIKPKSSWFHDFNDEKGQERTGDAIELLMLLYGFTFQESVMELINNGSVEPSEIPAQEVKEFIIPPKSDGSYRDMYRYLTEQRGLSIDTVFKLVTSGQLYEDKRKWVVCTDPQQRCYEKRAIFNTDDPHRGKGMKTDDFVWWGSGDQIYITEGFIDGLSLYEINHYKGIYVSLRGVANHQIIDRIIEKRHDTQRVIISVDNDDAGKACRDNYPPNDYIKHLIPNLKDWNLELKKRKGLLTCKN